MLRRRDVKLRISRHRDLLVGGRIEVAARGLKRTCSNHASKTRRKEDIPRTQRVLEKISSLAAVSFLVAEANMTSNDNDCCTASHQRTTQLLVTAIVILEGENVFSVFVVFTVGSPMVFGSR
jgi:hypothetical protein